MDRIYTIGVYGSDEADFFEALLEHKIDTFCDLRARRGMRGARYAFVNSKYLQEKLKALGIRYFHYKHLAPSKAARDRQKQVDQRKKVKKRERQQLSPAFVEAYERETLLGFDATGFVDSFGPDAHRVVLFCVEREPEACHRSLVARRLAHDLSAQVEHIFP